MYAIATTRVCLHYRLQKKLFTKKNSQLKLGMLRGLDELHFKVLYKTRDEIAYPLFLIFGKSLEPGIVPSDWKLAEHIAMYKKEPKSDRGNYRPISVTRVCSKMLTVVSPGRYYELFT